MGWSREAVKDYKALKKIDSEAWSVIGATLIEMAPDDESEEAPANGATAPKTIFSERLLRNILDLDPGQQVELCGYLAHRARWEYPSPAESTASLVGDPGAV